MSGRLRLASLAGLCLLALTSGCKGKTTVVGILVDGDGNPVDDATVVDIYGPEGPDAADDAGLPDSEVASAQGGVSKSSGSSGGSTESDGDGEFSLQVRSANVRDRDQALVLVSADGYAPQVMPVPRRPSTGSYLAQVRMHELYGFDMTAGQDLVLTGTVAGADLRLTVEAQQANGLVAQIALANPGEGPGTMEAIGGDGQSALQSGGMVYLRIIDDGGDEISDYPRIKLELTGLLLPELDGADDLKLYVLGKDGYWQEVETMQGSFGPGSTVWGWITGGWWNIDRELPSACYRGYLRTGDGANCSGAMVKAHGPQWFTSVGFSAQNGEFCVMGYRGEVTTLTIGDTVVQVTMGNSSGHCAWPETCRRETDPIVVDDAICAEVFDPPGSEVPSGPVGDDDDDIGGLPGWCQDYIDDLLEMYSDTPSDCAYMCIEDYADCVAMDNCADIDGPCWDTMYYDCLLGTCQT
jgi:hypothetical protein